MFSHSSPTIMHVDLNSCFASVEQQANPLLRGKPVAVAAYVADRGCILAASREAKLRGIKTGMRISEGKQIYPRLIVLPSDPEKYRFVNHALTKILSSYTDTLCVKSIDEMVMDMTNSPRLFCHPDPPPGGEGSLANVSSDMDSTSSPRAPRDSSISLRSTRNDMMKNMISIAQEIKQRIKNEIGTWLTVSIGIAPNRYLAKIASGLHKPDGLDYIVKENIEKILGAMQLEDLNGIKDGNAGRLRSSGIYTPVAMFHASPRDLQRAFRSIVGYQWWQRLHGFSDEGSTYAWNARDVQKTIGHSYALYKPYTPTDVKLHQILSQLVGKTGRRLRAHGFVALGIHVSCLASDYTYWHHGEKVPRVMYTDVDIYREAFRVLLRAPNKSVRILAVTTFSLQDNTAVQQSLFEDTQKETLLTQALDRIADRWGECTVFSGRMLGMEEKVLDRIAFGKV